MPARTTTMSPVLRGKDKWKEPHRAIRTTCISLTLAITIISPPGWSMNFMRFLFLATSIPVEFAN